MARLLKMSASAFAKGVKQGRFTPSKRDKNGKPLYDPAKIKKEYEATEAMAAMQDGAGLLPNDLKGGRPSGSSYNNDSKNTSQSYLKAKVANETIKANLQKIKLEAQMGKLVEKELVIKQGAELGTIMMGIIDSWASRLAPEFASMKDSDEHDFHQRLSRETNLLKQEIRKKCEQS